MESLTLIEYLQTFLTSNLIEKSGKPCDAGVRGVEHVMIQEGIYKK